MQKRLAQATQLRETGQAKQDQEGKKLMTRPPSQPRTPASETALIVGSDHNGDGESTVVALRLSDGVPLWHAVLNDLILCLLHGFSSFLKG